MFYEHNQRTLMLPLPKSPRVDISFTDIKLEVNVGALRKKKKTILNGVSGVFRSGELTAIMGPSGAGKSSLLNLLTGFQMSGMSGEIKINGEIVIPGQRNHKSQSCYIMQNDYLNPLFTVAEIMEMAAHLKLGDGLPGKAKAFVVEDLLDSLGLATTKDTKCGKLSGGQKKRLCIALELLDNPPMVFLDEPTTGLDSSTTAQMVTMLQGLAKNGRTIVCTIHQPSASVFEMFDHTFMLSKGECCYQGSSKNLVPFLQTIGLACPMYHNPADFILDVLNGDFGNFDDVMKRASKDPTWRIPPTPLEIPIEKPPTVTEESNKTMVLVSYPSETARFLILYKRNLIQLHRDWMTTYFKILLHFLVGTFTGSLYTGCGQDGSRIIPNLGFLMVAIVYSAFTSIMPAVLKIPNEINVLKKEQFNNWYRLRTYYAAFLTSQIPCQVINSLAFVSSAYYLSGQLHELDRFLKFAFIMCMTVVVSELMGITIGTTTTPVNGIFLGSVMLGVMILLGGFFANLTQMPRPLYYASFTNFMRYAFQALTNSVYGDHRATLPCPTTEFYCHLKYPVKIFSEMGLKGINYWNDAATLSGFIVFLGIYSYYSLRKMVKSRT